MRIRSCRYIICAEWKMNSKSCVKSFSLLLLLVAGIFSYIFIDALVSLIDIAADGWLTQGISRFYSIRAENGNLPYSPLFGYSILFVVYIEFSVLIRNFRSVWTIAKETHTFIYLSKLRKHQRRTCMKKISK